MQARVDGHWQSILGEQIARQIELMNGYPCGIYKG